MKDLTDSFRIIASQHNIKKESKNFKIANYFKKKEKPLEDLFIKYSIDIV